MGSVYAVLLSLVALVALGCVAQGVATRHDARRYAVSAMRVDAGGVRLHVAVSGPAGEGVADGVATVILDAGLGGTSLDWCLVAPTLAAAMPVCVYDRAGYGWSDAAPSRRTVGAFAAELRAALAAASVAPPYILVGHSCAALTVRAFACRFPSEVAGLVLVDGTSEDRLTALAPLGRVYDAVELLALGVVQLLAAVGLVRLVIALGLIPPVRRAFAKYPPEVRPVARAWASRTRFWRTVWREDCALAASCEEVRAKCGPLGNLPVVVLSRGLPAPLLRGAARHWLSAAWRDMQEHLTTLSIRCWHVVAQRSGHYIHLDEPELVVEAVRWVAAEARRTRETGSVADG